VLLEWPKIYKSAMQEAIQLNHIIVGFSGCCQLKQSKQLLNWLPICSTTPSFGLKGLTIHSFTVLHEPEETFFSKLNLPEICKFGTYWLWHRCRRLWINKRIPRELMIWKLLLIMKYVYHPQTSSGSPTSHIFAILTSRDPMMTYLIIQSYPIYQGETIWRYL
jgi:hypothetical protein